MIILFICKLKQKNILIYHILVLFRPEISESHGNDLNLKSQIGKTFFIKINAINHYNTTIMYAVKIIVIKLEIKQKLQFFFYQIRLVIHYMTSMVLYQRSKFL